MLSFEGVIFYIFVAVAKTFVLSSFCLLGLWVRNGEKYMVFVFLYVILQMTGKYEFHTVK
jgi:hypothetical protein